MKFGVFGTGMVAKTVAGKLAELGHDVMLGTRDVAATLASDKPDMAGGPPISAWLVSHLKASLGTFAEAGAHGDLFINALSGQGALAGLRSAGAASWAGSILIDISNPLDFSRGMPPSLTICNTDSLGEQIQQEFPQARVVKTLNTVSAPLMVNPAQLAGGHTMFVCGNDAAAKVQVTGLLKDGFGWQDVMDLGDITNARGTEMWLPLWVRLYGSLQTPLFGLKIVR